MQIFFSNDNYNNTPNELATDTETETDADIEIEALYYDYNNTDTEINSNDSDNTDDSEHKWWWPDTAFVEKKLQQLQRDDPSVLAWRTLMEHDIPSTKASKDWYPFRNELGVLLFAGRYDPS